MSGILNTAVRPDLASVKPMYYPVVEQRRFGSVAAMCKRMGFSVELVNHHVERARLECSALVVIDQLTLGPPEDRMAAVLVMQAGGGVVLCAGLFGELEEEPGPAEALLKEFAAKPDFKDKLLAIGEYRANPQRAAS